MEQTLSRSELINRKVDSVAYTLNEIAKQLRNVSPHLRVYKGRGDRFNYDPSGLIERITLRLYFAVTQNNRVGGLVEGIYCETGGTYDHREVQSFLDETLHSLKSQRFTTMVGVYKFYIKFREMIWKFRED